MTDGADIGDVIGLVAELAIGAVFVVAGASKIARSREWPAQAADLGAPGWLAPLVPWWEIALGALLVVGLLSPWAALLATATLVSFTVAIAVQLRRGRHPRCACFGAWSAAPLGARHVWRNAGFLSLAVLAAWLG